jgi:hypothetical protein
MYFILRHLIVSALTLVSITGCLNKAYSPTRPYSMNISRTVGTQYNFISNTKTELPDIANSIYAKDIESYVLSAYLTSPPKTLIKFNNNFFAYPIPDVDPTPRPLKLSTGVFPFEITPFPVEDAGMPKDSHLSGALIVFNLDNTVELASFGKSAETILFKPEIIEKALNGTLTEGTISFDDKPRIRYWIGNRNKLFIGGEPTAEVDFSKNTDITELKIAGRTIDNFVGEVSIYKKDKSEKKKTENEFYIKFKNGKAFKGYLRNIEENATTAFVKIPCTIPQNLLDAAEKGTIAKLKIHAEGTQKAETIESATTGVTSKAAPKEVVSASAQDEIIAEIVFGFVQ